MKKLALTTVSLLALAAPAFVVAQTPSTLDKIKASAR